MSFNDPFSVLFGNGGDSRRNNANNDDPIILDVEADGDGPARNTNAGPSGSSRLHGARPIRVSPVSQRPVAQDPAMAARF